MHPTHRSVNPEQRDGQKRTARVSGWYFNFYHLTRLINGVENPEPMFKKNL